MPKGAMMRNYTGRAQFCESKLSASDIMEGLGLLIMLYLVMVFAFSCDFAAHCVDGRPEVYMPFWHWPVKVLSMLFG